MDPALLTQLAQASTDTERKTIVLEMSLAQLPNELTSAAKAAAIPHWFDFSYLSALIGEDACDLIYDDLLELSFVDHIPGRGYTIHERTRLPLLDKLWTEDSLNFKRLSRLAAEYCYEQSDNSFWLSEEIYHQLVSDLDLGVTRFQEMATAWANFEQTSFEDIEQVTRLVEEHITAGRLEDSAASLTRLWQARLSLLYSRPGLAFAILEKAGVNEEDRQYEAERNNTLGDILEALGDAEGAKNSWQKSADLFNQLNQPFNRYLVASKFVQTHPESSPKSHPSHPPGKSTVTLQPDNPFRNRLLDTIESNWIDGVLNESVGLSQQSLDLPLESHESYVQRNRLVAHQPGGVDVQLGQDANLAGLFEASGRSLLILGAPGSGKTITLLQLLQQQIDMARKNRSYPIPLFFNLSSFGNFEGSFEGWLVEQAHNQFNLKRESARDGILRGTEYILLFDGLDEINDVRRNECVLAINAFIENNPAGMVVCSRIKDYRELEDKLDMHQAVVIQPLTNMQMESTLSNTGRSDLYKLTTSNWRLRESLRSPLLMSLASQAVQPNEIEQFANQPIDSIEGWQNSIFARYADQTLPADSAKKDRVWIKNLASMMSSAGTSVFSIEDLQPSSLATDKLRGRYSWWSGVLFGITLGAVIGFIFTVSASIIGISQEGFSIDGALALLISPFVGFGLGAFAGAFFGIYYWISNWAVKKVDLPSARFSMAVFISSLFFIPITLIGQLDVEAFAAGLMLAIGFGISAYLLGTEDLIRPKDQIKVALPTFETLRQHFKIALAITILLTIFGSSLGGLFETGSITDSLSNFVANARGIINIAALTGLATWIALASLTTPPLNDRPFPGYGIRASLRNAIIMSTAISIIYGFSGWALDTWYEADGQLIGVLLVLLLPFGFAYYGGVAWVRHWALRFMLWWNGKLPFRLGKWLNQMSNKGILRRAGSTFIFRHRSLLEFFKELKS